MADKRHIGLTLYFTALCLILGTLLSCNPSDTIPFEQVPESPVPDGPGPDDSSDPSQPVDPVEPESPTNPVEPEQPTDPTDPEEPTVPEEPELPQQPAEGKSIVFVEGVTSASGWYDVNKMGDGTLNGDVNMCWAAASANMIQWWQDRYVAAGKSLPSTAV